jgi:hypothetical protein
MDASADVISLARNLLTLARAGCTGILTISASGKQCRVALVQGSARAATASGESALLGDWLLRRGELDVAAHAAALSGDSPCTPVGAWLVAHGVASQAAIERALQDQLRARVLLAFRWRDVSHVFEPGSSDIGMPWLQEPVDVGQLALTAVRAVIDPLTLDGWLRARAQTALVLSAFGRALLRTSPFSELAPELDAVLSRGARVQQIVDACRGSDDALRSFGALYALGAIVPASQGNQYSILLRKRAQLRRRVSAAELLEVGRDARAQDVRRAVRRLAKHVHPDALGPLAPASLREASSELMRALLQAERELRPLRVR